MSGHYRVTLLGRGGGKAFRFVRYHEPPDATPSAMIGRIAAIVAKLNPDQQAQLARIVVERVDESGRAV